jgi:hypothetical protein
MIKVTQIKTYNLKCDKCLYEITLTEEAFDKLDFTIKELHKCEMCGDTPENKPKRFKGGIIRKGIIK